MTRPERLLAVAWIVYVAGLIALAFGYRATWGDEGHFIDTVRLFAADLAAGRLADRVRDYPEMAGPLGFVLYAGWGTLVGLTVPALRLFTILLAVGTIGLLVRLVRRLLPGDSAALGWILGVTLVNPYTVGLSAFVFTDQLLWLGLMGGLICWVGERPVRFAAVSAVGLVARLYLIFLPFAAGLAGLIGVVWGRRTRADARWMAAAVVSLVPILGLMLVWGGVAPESGRLRWVPHAQSPIHPGYLTLYLALPAVYLAPLVARLWREIYADRRVVWAGVGLAALIYPLAPVRPSEVTLTQTDKPTVGLFHRLLERLLPDGLAVDLVFAALLALSLPIWWTLARGSVRRFRQSHRLDDAARLDLVWLAYLMLMPFSYSVWEKYFIPLVPVLALRLWMAHRHGPETTR